MELAGEFRRVYQIQVPEMQLKSKFVFNEEDQREVEEFEDTARKYYRAKWDFYVASKLDQLKLTTKELEEK